MLTSSDNLDQMAEELEGRDVFESEKKRRYLIEVIERINMKRKIRDKQKIIPDVSGHDYSLLNIKKRW